MNRVGSRKKSNPPGTWTESGQTPALRESSSSREGRTHPDFARRGREVGGSWQSEAVTEQDPWVEAETYTWEQDMRRELADSASGEDA